MAKDGGWQQQQHEIQEKEIKINELTKYF